MAAELWNIKWVAFTRTITLWLAHHGLNNSPPDEAQFEGLLRQSRVSPEAVFQTAVVNYADTYLAPFICVAVADPRSPVQSLVSVPVQAFAAWVATQGTQATLEAPLRLTFPWLVVQKRATALEDWVWAQDHFRFPIPNHVSRHEPVRRAMPTVLRACRRIQGAASFTVLQPSEGEAGDRPVFVLLGDYHSPYTCDQPCEPPTCLRVESTFYEELNAACSPSSPCDVYMETWASRGVRSGEFPFRPEWGAAGPLLQAINTLLPCSIRHEQSGVSRPECRFPNLRVHYGDVRHADNEAQARLHVLQEALMAADPQVFHGAMEAYAGLVAPADMAEALLSPRATEGLVNPALAGDRLYHEFRQLDRRSQVLLVKAVQARDRVVPCYDCAGWVKRWVQLNHRAPAPVPMQVVGDVLEPPFSDLRWVTAVDVYTLARILKPPRDPRSPPVRVAVVHMGDFHCAQQTLLLQALGYRVVQSVVRGPISKRCLDLENPEREQRIPTPRQPLTRLVRPCGPVGDAAHVFHAVQGIPLSAVAHRPSILARALVGTEQNQLGPEAQRAFTAPWSHEEIVEHLKAMERAHGRLPRAHSIPRGSAFHRRMTPEMGALPTPAHSRTSMRTRARREGARLLRGLSLKRRNGRRVSKSARRRRKRPMYV